MEFAIAALGRDGLFVRGQFFDEFSDALDAVGLGD